MAGFCASFTPRILDGLPIEFWTAERTNTGRFYPTDFGRFLGGGCGSVRVSSVWFWGVLVSGDQGFIFAKDNKKNCLRADNWGEGVRFLKGLKRYSKPECLLQTVRLEGSG